MESWPSPSLFVAFEVEEESSSSEWMLCAEAAVSFLSSWPHLLAHFATRACHHFVLCTEKLVKVYH